jgi:hypothetical protein
MLSMSTQSLEEKLRKELFKMGHNSMQSQGKLRSIHFLFPPENWYAERRPLPSWLTRCSRDNLTVIVTTMTQVRGARGAIPTDHAYLIVTTASNGRGPLAKPLQARTFSRPWTRRTGMTAG